MSEKIQVTKVNFNFSENSELANREFNSMEEADIAVMRAMALKDARDNSYDKTDVTIVWADGFTKTTRLDANRINNSVSRWVLDNVMFYVNKKASWLNERDAHLAALEANGFLNTYAI